MKDLSDAYLPKMHCQDVLSAKTRIPALIFNYRNSGKDHGTWWKKVHVLGTNTTFSIYNTFTF